MFLVWNKMIKVKYSNINSKKIFKLKMTSRNKICSIIN